MDRRLILVFVLFLALLIAFISTIYISELKNMDQLRVEYPGLKEVVYSYRKDSLKVWAINMVLSFIIPGVFLISEIGRAS